jgi:hypothetical protein
MTRPDELKAALANAQAVYDQAAKHESLSASVMLADLRLLIDAARQAEAWREVALAERERHESGIRKLADITEQAGAPKAAEAMRVAAGLVAALPAPEPKGA